MRLAIREFVLIPCGFALFVGLTLVASLLTSPAFGQSATSDAGAAEPASRRDDAAERFLRVRKDYRGRQIAMETSITRYELTREDGQRVAVDLIGAVHVGEKSYFESLNDHFKTYDTVLYELVAPEGTIIPRGGRGETNLTNPVAAMQKGLQSILGLEFQLEFIDYTADNFRHADMTPEEFVDSMKRNDESISKYALKAIGQSMAMQSAGRGGDSVGMLMAMFSSNKELKMRRVFAEQMRNMESGMIMFEGKDGSTIIDHRNAKCMEVLKAEIAAGSETIAIFYGAGHLPDMERRLMSDFQARRGGQTWLEAWQLNRRD